MSKKTILTSSSSPEGPSPTSWNLLSSSQHRYLKNSFQVVHKFFWGNAGAKTRMHANTKDSGLESSSSRDSFPSHWPRVSSCTEVSDVHDLRPTQVAKNPHFCNSKVQISHLESPSLEINVLLVSWVLVGGWRML